jgi:hypothetical protein
MKNGSLRCRSRAEAGRLSGSLATTNRRQASQAEADQGHGGGFRHGGDDAVGEEIAVDDAVAVAGSERAELTGGHVVEGQQDVLEAAADEVGFVDVDDDGVVGEV